MTQHALQQMFKRNISPHVVKELINTAEVIKDYPDDKPYPSKLLLGFKNSLPLHVVVAYNYADMQMIIVTAYVPDTGIWTDNLKTKR